MTNQGNFNEKGKETLAAVATWGRRRATVATGTGKPFLGVATEQTREGRWVSGREGRENSGPAKQRGFSKRALNCLCLDSDVSTLARIPAVRYGPVTQHGFSSVASLEPLLWFP